MTIMHSWIAVPVNCITTIFVCVWHAHISARRDLYSLAQLMHIQNKHTNCGWTANLACSWALLRKFNASEAYVRKKSFWICMHKFAVKIAKNKKSGIDNASFLCIQCFSIALSNKWWLAVDFWSLFWVKQHTDSCKLDVNLAHKANTMLFLAQLAFHCTNNIGT